MADKIYTFKVSSDKKIFRVIEIRGNKSLYDFAEAIVKSFDFDFDHAFGFYNNINDAYQSDEVYELFVDMPNCNGTIENAQSVEKTMINKVFILKKPMLFLFDYGDNWFFLIECVKVSEPILKQKYPRVIEQVGIAPEQYPENG